jgi:hypothetical protein
MAAPARLNVRAWPLPTAVLIASLVAGCAGGGVFGDRSPAPTAAPASAPSDMAGRWALTATGATCAVNLGAGAAPNEGTVRPEGGCAGKFFTTRKWTFENDALILRDHTGKPLAQLTLLAPGRFEGGTAAGGQHVSLVR